MEARRATKMTTTMAFVTGGSGFVGSAVIRKLVARGFSVRALVRQRSDRRNLEGLDAVEPVVGDLGDSAALRRAIDGCAVLFHVAAEYRLWHPRPKEIYRSNVEGTRNVMTAAIDAGVTRVVYTSSVATLGLRAEGAPSDETTPAGLEDMLGHYKRSKFLAEEEVRRLVVEKGLPAVIVNPSAPIGPRDIKPTPTGRMVLDAAAGRTKAYVDTGLNVVHVDDVAEGHIQALEKGRAGERYILGERNMTFREILVEIADIVGGKAPRIRLSPSALLPVAWVAQVFARVTGGREPRVTVDGLRMARKRMFFSSEKARRELSFAPRPARAALVDAIEWFRSAGYLR